MHMKIVRVILHTSFRVSFVCCLVMYAAVKCLIRPTPLKCIVGVEVVLHAF
jgi:hypothetical protein